MTMGMKSSTAVLDGLLNIIKSNTEKLTVCNTQPTTYTQANATYRLAVSSSLASTDFTLANSTVSDARKVTGPTISGVSVVSSGQAQHTAAINATSSKLLYVWKNSTSPIKSVTTADTVTINPVVAHVLQPTSST